MTTAEAERIGVEAALTALHEVLERCGERRRSLEMADLDQTVGEVVDDCRTDLVTIFGHEFAHAAASLLTGALIVSTYTLNEAARRVEAEAVMS